MPLNSNRRARVFGARVGESECGVRSLRGPPGPQDAILAFNLLLLCLKRFSQKFWLTGSSVPSRIFQNLN